MLWEAAGYVAVRLRESGEENGKVSGEKNSNRREIVDGTFESCAESSGRRAGAHPWWEDCDGREIAGIFLRMKNSGHLFTTSIHNPDVFGCWLSPFKPVQPTRACNSHSCGRRICTSREAALPGSQLRVVDNFPLLGS